MFSHHLIFYDPTIEFIDEGKTAARRDSVTPFYHIGWEEESKYKDIFEMGENLEEIPLDFLSVGKILVENKAQKTDVADFQRRGQKSRRKARKEVTSS